MYATNYWNLMLWESKLIYHEKKSLTHLIVGYKQHSGGENILLPNGRHV